MTKKTWKIICIVSAIVLLTVVGVFVMMILSISSTLQRPHFGIIGGADYPTTGYVIDTVLFHSPLFYPFFIVGILAILLLVVSGIVLVYKKTHP